MFQDGFKDGFSQSLGAASDCDGAIRTIVVYQDDTIVGLTEPHSRIGERRHIKEVFDRVQKAMDDALKIAKTLLSLHALYLSVNSGPDMLVTSGIPPRRCVDEVKRHGRRLMKLRIESRDMCGKDTLGYPGYTLR